MGLKKYIKLSQNFIINIADFCIISRQFIAKQDNHLKFSFPAKVLAQKQKQKNEVKKPKKSKSQNQVLLFQYFPNLNQKKSQVYENILTKPNAVFKEEKKLNKQILNEQNQIIKEINNLYREVFKEADHEQINMLAQLFRQIQQEKPPTLVLYCPFSSDQNLSEPNKQSKTYLSPEKPITHQDYYHDNSQYSRTVTAKKPAHLDLADFQFHESKYKEKYKENFQEQRKYKLHVLPLEETLTVFGSGEKAEIRNKSFIKRSKSIDWNQFEFKPSLTKRHVFSQKVQINSVVQEIEKKESPRQDTLLSLSQQTYTLVPNLNQNCIKRLPFQKNEREKIDNIKPQLDQTSEYMSQKQKSQKILQKMVSQNSNLITQSHKSITLTLTTQLADSLHFFEIGCESGVKACQIQEQKRIAQKIKKGIEKIIQIIEKKQKAKQQQANFRRYVQQVKQKNELKTTREKLEQCIKIDSQYAAKQQDLNDEKICLVKRKKEITLQRDEDFDVLSCILHRDPQLNYICYFQGDQQDHNHDERPPKQIRSQFQGHLFPMHFGLDHQDQESTKQQSQSSENTVSSSRFVSYIDSLKPTFNVPQHFLTGYLRGAFNANFFKQIHQTQLQKVRYQTQILDQII